MIRLLILFSLLSLTGKELILWSSDYKLRPEDFTGKPDQTVPYHAKTYCSISQEVKTIPGGMPHFTVHSYFDKEKSWMKPGKATAGLLEHEQLHFDLTELYARKLKQRLDSLNFEDEAGQAELQAMFDQIIHELEAETNRYDTETLHGVYPEKQKEWEEETARLLEKE